MNVLEPNIIEEQSGLLAAIQNTDICTFWYYPKEKRITVSQRTAQMYNCKREYLDMPKSFADEFVHPSSQEVFYEMYRRIDGGEPTAQASFSSIDRRNWCTVTMTTVAFDSQGNPDKTYAVIQNISKLKMQEAEYHNSKQTLSSIITALGKIYMFNYFIDMETMEFTEIQGIDYITALLGTEGDVVHAFQVFTDTLIDDSSKEDFRAFVHMASLSERLGARQNISLEYLSRKMGWCRASFIVVNRDWTGIPLQVEFVVENISTERKKELEAKEALEKAYTAANKANASKSAFLNNMSHDIRTPLNAIIGFSTIAQSHINNPERVQDCISKIITSSRHLLSIINEVLDMSRIESGKIRIQEQETNLPTILHDFINMIHEQVRIKGLNLFINTSDLAHENVYADESRLQRALLNIIGNAVKFTPGGGSISIRLWEKPQTDQQHGNYVISVKDTGIGISPDFLPHVFEPFERERTSTVSKVDGTGLGMAITKQVIEMMGGKISVESVQGQGAEFTLEIPLRLSEKALTDPRIEKLAGLHAMVVDDDYNVCNSVSKMLSKIGMEPEWTMSGREAILHTQSALEMGKQFSAYMIDWKIPDMSGIEVVRQLRELAGDQIPIYLLTAYDFSDMEADAKRAGATAIFQKPLFLSQLRTALLESLEEQPEVPENGSAPYVDLSGKHILLVEDNELNQEIAVDVLTEAGFLVDTADDGSIAVEKIARAQEWTYDAVLMDIQMPVMDGYEATRTIRAMPNNWTKRLPILALTANAFEEDRKKALEAGMNDHLAKPIDIDKLFHTLEAVLK